MADENFSNNPFKSLKAKQFPDRGTAGRDSEALIRKARKARKSVPPEEQKETELFLLAMDGVEPEKEHGKAVKGKGHAAPEVQDKGFSMATQCDFSGVAPLNEKKKAQKHRKHAAAAPVAKKPAADAVQKAPAEPEDDMTMEELLHSGETDPAFSKAMEGVQPLTNNGREVTPPVDLSAATPVPGNNPLQDFVDGKLEFALSFTDEYCEGYVVGLDLLTVGKLRQGAFSPEASVDLHGLNVQQAFETLRGFFKASWYRGIRCVIVVPGRGKNSPDGVGILREKLKLWLTQEPFKRVVLAFCTAQPHDGGAGSLYVLLRKYKKKGRVYWDRMPADEDLF